MTESRRDFLKSSPALLFGLSQISKTDHFNIKPISVNADQVREILQSANYNALDPELNLENIARGRIKQIKYSGDKNTKPFDSYEFDFYSNNERTENEGFYKRKIFGQRLYISDGIDNTQIDGRVDYFTREDITNIDGTAFVGNLFRGYNLEQTTQVAQSLWDVLGQYFK